MIKPLLYTNGFRFSCGGFICFVLFEKLSAVQHSALWDVQHHFCFLVHSSDVQWWSPLVTEMHVIVAQSRFLSSIACSYVRKRNEKYYYIFENSTWLLCNYITNGGKYLCLRWSFLLICKKGTKYLVNGWING